MIGPEWVETVATAIPVVTASGLVLWGQGWLWRRHLWDLRGAALVDLAGRLGGPIRPRWTGWAVAGPRGRLVVDGGLAGERTVIRVGEARFERAGFPPPDELDRLLGGVGPPDQAS